MSEQELANVEPTAVMLIAGAVFIITVIAAIILQILAFRHKREFGSAYMLKDSSSGIRNWSTRKKACVTSTGKSAWR